MGLGNKFGLMSQGMKGTGLMIRLTDMVNCFMLMGISMRVNGKMTKQTEEVHIPMQMEQNTQEIGRMINSMGLVSRHGLITQYMKDNTGKGKRMVTES